MTAAVRKTPTVANGGARDGTDYLNAVDAEIEALWTVASGWLISIGGTGNAITASTDTAIVAAIGSYKRPMRFYYQPTAVNSTAVTINIDGVGAISVLDKNGAVLQGGEFAIGSVYPLVFDGAAVRGETIVAGAANAVKSAPDIILQDQKTSGTAGGNFVSGAWRQRTLNTSVRNVIAGASLASNQLTLPAGTYYAEWRAPGYSVRQHQTRLYNATDSTVLAYGTSEANFPAAPANTWSSGGFVFTIASSKAIEIDHQCSSTENTDGFGVACGFGNTEIFTELRIWKQ